MKQLSSQFKKPTKIYFLIFFILFFSIESCFAQEIYQTKEEFLSSVFTDADYKIKSLWLDQAFLDQAENILGHPFSGFRVRYWSYNGENAWIIDEVGKERPITVGVFIQGNKISSVSILAFRESRGWEVKNNFFTRQFKDAFLKNGYSLSNKIDGISGATLSVRAVKKAAALALYFNQHAS